MLSGSLPRSCPILPFRINTHVRFGTFDVCHAKASNLKKKNLPTQRNIVFIWVCPSPMSTISAWTNLPGIKLQMVWHWKLSGFANYLTVNISCQGCKEYHSHWRLIGFGVSYLTVSGYQGLQQMTIHTPEIIRVCCKCLTAYWGYQGLPQATIQPLEIIRVCWKPPTVSGN